MSRRRRSAIALGVAFASLVALVSCEVLVSGDLPQYQCTGNDPDSCPAGFFCDETHGICVPNGTPTPLPDGRVPPTPEGGDEPKPTISPLGGPCTRDSECLDGLLCGTTTLLTAGIIRDGVPLCTKPCCTSKDCDDGFVCYAPATGGNYCVKATLADRTVGTKNPGEDCALPEDCRSGLCEKQLCKDTCCGGASECGGDTSCRYGTGFTGPTVSGIQYHHLAWACEGYGDTDGDAGPNSGCSEGFQCGSRLCVQGKPGPPILRCTPTCCTTDDCRAQGFPAPACAYVKVGLDYLKQCLDAPASGLADDATCSSDLQCASHFCDPSTLHCARVCCRKTDCKPEENCEPVPSGQPLLRCVKAH